MKSRESLEPSLCGTNYPEVGDVVFLTRPKKFARIYKIVNLVGFQEGWAETLGGEIFGIFQDVPVEGMTEIVPVKCVMEDYHHRLIHYTEGVRMPYSTREFTFEYACPEVEEWFLEELERGNNKEKDGNNNKRKL